MEHYWAADGSPTPTMKIVTYLEDMAGNNSYDHGTSKLDYCVTFGIDEGDPGIENLQIRIADGDAIITPGV